eukprot:5247621-Pyramimonas_sp.AAC.1
MRQPVARRWELGLGSSAFWGDAAHTCDRSGHVHNILARFAKLKGFSSASGMLDLSKYYEYISHEELRGEAVKTGFPLRLLR